MLHNSLRMLCFETLASSDHAPVSPCCHDRCLTRCWCSCPSSVVVHHVCAVVHHVCADGSCWRFLQGRCDETDPYWSYEGVVRGVTEGACDVGFTNNTVFINYTRGGTQQQAWSTKPASDFRILCSTGGCAPVDQADRCSNAKVRAFYKQCLLSLCMLAFALYVRSASC